MSILGAWRNAVEQQEEDEVFAFLERILSDCTAYTFELQAYDVVGDMAYIVGSPNRQQSQLGSCEAQRNHSV